MRIIKYTDLVNEVNFSSTISVIMQLGFIFSLTARIFQEGTLRGKTRGISGKSFLNESKLIRLQSLDPY